MLTIKDSTNFSADKIANSGQIFRASVLGNETHFISGGEYAIVTNDKTIQSTNDDYFKHYFDLTTDYGAIEKTLGLPNAIEKAGRGIRILRADFVEMVVSFIISANNNIKRIKKIIAALCEKYGERRSFGEISYFAFPTLEKLSTIDVNNFFAMGAGYRAPYLVKTIQKLHELSFEKLAELPDGELRRELLRLSGVGAKVADCIMLFAFHRLGHAPVDVHIKKALSHIDFSGEYAGVAQQYVFYYLQHLGYNLNDGLSVD